MNPSKNITSHLVFALIYFVLLTLLKGWLDLLYIPFWIGALVGTFLPDVDHLIYVYFLRPHELASQRVIHSIQDNHNIKQTLSVLNSTAGERTKLIFHTALFQIVFLFFTFFVVSSSSNLFGRGLVLAFSLHLLADEFVDVFKTGNLSVWFKGLAVNLDQKQTVFYWSAILLMLVYFGFVI